MRAGGRIEASLRAAPFVVRTPFRRLSVSLGPWTRVDGDGEQGTNPRCSIVSRSDLALCDARRQMGPNGLWVDSVWGSASGEPNFRVLVSQAKPWAGLEEHTMLAGPSKPNRQGRKTSEEKSQMGMVHLLRSPSPFANPPHKPAFQTPINLQAFADQFHTAPPMQLCLTSATHLVVAVPLRTSHVSGMSWKRSACLCPAGVWDNADAERLG